MQEAVSEAAVAERLKLEQTALSGARWFYWIAALSAFNTVSMWFELNWFFFIALGVTQFVDGLGYILGSYAALASILLNAAIIGGFAMLGRLAQRWRPAYLIGIAVFALDGLFVLYFQDFFGFGFHLLAIFFVYQGFAAARKIDAAPAQPIAATPEGAEAVAAAEPASGPWDSQELTESTEVQGVSMSGPRTAPPKKWIWWALAIVPVLFGTAAWLGLPPLIATAGFIAATIVMLSRAFASQASLVAALGRCPDLHEANPVDSKHGDNRLVVARRLVRNLEPDHEVHQCAKDFVMASRAGQGVYWGGVILGFRWIGVWVGI